LGRDEWNS